MSINSSSTSPANYRSEDIQMEEATRAFAAVSPLENVNAAMEILTVRMTNLLNRTLDGNLSGVEKEQTRIEYVQSITDLENCKKPKILLEASSAPVISAPAASSWLIPTYLPLFQWGNQVVDRSKQVFNTVEEFVTRFETILRSHGQDLDSNWYRLLPRCLTSGQLDWFSEALGDKAELSWKDAANRLLTNYGPDDAMKEYNARNNFMNIRMEESESVEAFTERFQRTRMAANFPDDKFCAHLFANRLAPFLSYQVLIFFADSIASMTGVEPIATKARNLSQHLLSNPDLVAGSTIAAAARGMKMPTGSTGAASSRGWRKPKGSVGPTALGSFSHKKNTTHTTKDCQVMKDVAARVAAQRNLSSGRSTGGIKKFNTCSRCKGPYSPGHREVCPARTSRPHAPSGSGSSSSSAGSPMIHRSMGVNNVVVSPGAPTGSATQTKVGMDWTSTNNQVDQNGQLPRLMPMAFKPTVVVPATTTVIGTAEASAELACASSQCKYQMDPNCNAITDDSIYVPITVEGYQTWAFVDCGSTFSAIKPDFVSFLGLSVSGAEGTIVLGGLDKTIPRLGSLNKTKVYYNGKDFDHNFEVFNFTFKVPVCIGLDFMKKQNMNISNLATSWEIPSGPKIQDPIDPSEIIPNDSPAGSMAEHELMMSIIEPHLEANGRVPITSCCSLLGAVVTLDTVPGVTTFRRQFSIPVALQPKLDEQMQKWLADGVVELALPNTEWNSPILFVKKKDANGNYNDDVRPCTDSRHINQLLTKKDRFPLPLISDLFTQMGNADWFTTLDLKQAFHRFNVVFGHSLCLYSSYSTSAKGHVRCRIYCHKHFLYRVR